MLKRLKFSIAALFRAAEFSSSIVEFRINLNKIYTHRKKERKKRRTRSEQKWCHKPSIKIKIRTGKATDTRSETKIERHGNTRFEAGCDDALSTCAGSPSPSFFRSAPLAINRRSKPNDIFLAREEEKGEWRKKDVLWGLIDQKGKKHSFFLRHGILWTEKSNLGAFVVVVQSVGGLMGCCSLINCWQLWAPRGQIDTRPVPHSLRGWQSPGPCRG